MIMAGSKSRIALIGAGGVGKTTLLNELFKDNNIIQSYTKIDEVVRTLCAERGYNSPYAITEDVHKFREDLLERQIQLENACERFIADRSTLDAWAYYMRWSWNYLEVERAEIYYQQAMLQAQKYDLLIYIPIMFPAEDDGFRWTNPVYHKQIDRLLKSIVLDWGLEDRVYEIKSESTSHRLQELHGLGF